MSIIDDDVISNSSGNEPFQEVIAKRMSRRDFLGSSLAAATVASFGGMGALLNSVPAIAKPRHHGKSLLGFEGIAVSTADAVVLPKGYTAKVLVAWGDPVSVGPTFRQDASNSAADQALQWGMHNDGMVYFPINGSARGQLVQNNEYTDNVLLFPDGTANWNQEKTNKSLAAHGVSIVEISKKGGKGKKGGKWRVERPSKYARRITGMTPISVSGPAAGDDRLKTSVDPTGRVVLGTLNNCAMGFTPSLAYHRHALPRRRGAERAEPFRLGG